MAYIENPDQYQRITAVIVNADGRAKGYDNALGDWKYTHDNERFKFTIQCVSCPFPPAYCRSGATPPRRLPASDRTRELALLPRPTG